jgi:hypothetical protein
VVGERAIDWVDFGERWMADENRGKSRCWISKEMRDLMKDNIPTGMAFK